MLRAQALPLRNQSPWHMGKGQCLFHDKMSLLGRKEMKTTKGQKKRWALTFSFYYMNWTHHPQRNQLLSHFFFPTAPSNCLPRKISLQGAAAEKKDKAVKKEKQQAATTNARLWCIGQIGQGAYEWARGILVFFSLYLLPSMQFRLSLYQSMQVTLAKKNKPGTWFVEHLSFQQAARSKQINNAIGKKWWWMTFNGFLQRKY